MCDYSLHAVASRAATAGETLVTTRFDLTSTRGFSGLDDPRVAVCLRPGTELAFEADAQRERMMFHHSVGARLARFRQIDLDSPMHHHDALEFSNGTIVLLTDLVPGQRAAVVQLPANPAESKSEPATDTTPIAETGNPIVA
jgi:hypothetical protein